jgi:hypothetical protein
VFDDSFHNGRWQKKLAFSTKPVYKDDDDENYVFDFTEVTLLLKSETPRNECLGLLVTINPEKVFFPNLQFTTPSRTEPIWAGFECCICMGSNEEETSVVKTACGHCFHGNCLNRWFVGGKRSCPYCRATVGILA